MAHPNLGVSCKWAMNWEQLAFVAVLAGVALVVLVGIALWFWESRNSIGSCAQLLGTRVWRGYARSGLY